MHVNTHTWINCTVDSDLVIRFVGTAAQLAEDLIVNVVLVERVETLAIVGDARIEWRVEAKQMVVARKHVTWQCDRQ
jgi:hypothetical protein